MESLTFGSSKHNRLQTVPSIMVLVLVSWGILELRCVRNVNETHNDKGYGRPDAWRILSKLRTQGELPVHGDRALVTLNKMCPMKLRLYKQMQVYRVEYVSVMVSWSYF
jgi:hypothetical protein